MRGQNSMPFRRYSRTRMAEFATGIGILIGDFDNGNFCFDGSALFTSTMRTHVVADARITSRALYL